MKESKVIKNRVYKALLMIGVLLVFSSCGIFKSTSKHSDKLKTEIKVKETISTNDSVHTESNVEKTKKDSSLTTIERETTKTETQKGTTTTIKGKVNPKGATELVDSLGNKVILMYDSLATKIEVIIKTPDKEVKTTTKEKITTQANTKEQEKEKTNTTIQKQVAITRDDEFKHSSAIVTKESTPSPLALIVSILAVGLVIIGIIWFLIKQINPNKYTNGY